jgi:hypothetical protein
MNVEAVGYERLGWTHLAQDGDRISFQCGSESKYLKRREISSVTERVLTSQERLVHEDLRFSLRLSMNI